ncbi:MAG: glycosyltransferase family A protein [bacterium]
MPGDDATEVTLVVCTRNRARYLPGCLDALRMLRSAKPWELVLVDNGSMDETPRILAEFARTAPFPVVLVHEPRPRLTNARNAGVIAARGELIVFTDDDCYPSTDFLDQWLSVFADPQIGFGGGRILLHDPDDHPISILTTADPMQLPPYGFIEPGEVQGANMAYRRHVLFKVGGFDPALGPGSLFNFEDLDMSSRAAAAGYLGGYFPGPIVEHHHRRRTPKDVEALKRSYAQGRGAYFASLLLRLQAPRALAVHLYHSTRRKAASQILRELFAGVLYLLYRLVRPRQRPLANLGLPPRPLNQNRPLEMTENITKEGTGGPLLGD